MIGPQITEFFGRAAGSFMDIFGGGYGAKKPLDGYVRCETLMRILACRIAHIPGSPTRRALGLMTEDGALALGITAESAQELSELLAKAATDMRETS